MARKTADVEIEITAVFREKVQPAHVISETSLERVGFIYSCIGLSEVGKEGAELG